VTKKRRLAQLCSVFVVASLLPSVFMHQQSAHVALIWTPAASMNTARSNLTATPLPSGKVLVVGGFAGSNNPVRADFVFMRLSC